MCLEAHFYRSVCTDTKTVLNSFKSKPTEKPTSTADSVAKTKRSKNESEPSTLGSD